MRPPRGTLRITEQLDRASLVHLAWENDPEGGRFVDTLAERDHPCNIAGTIFGGDRVVPVVITIRMRILTLEPASVFNIVNA